MVNIIPSFILKMFGAERGNSNVVVETLGHFRVNQENQADRDLTYSNSALKQFSGEFRQSNRGGFDRFMDGVNRLPRPAMALGCLALFVAAMIDPVWFAARMTGIALVPEPLWWLLGVIVSFYFGSRYQTKGQEFKRSMSQSLGDVPRVVETIQMIETLQEDDASIQFAEAKGGEPSMSENEVLKDLGM